MRSTSSSIPDAVAAAITPRTQAIVPVHLFGQVAPVELLTPIAAMHGLTIVEDAAQSHGATRHGRPAGSLGRVAATSFYPGKNLGASGDGGAVVTDEADLARLVRLMGNHGSIEKYRHEILGFNSRLDAIHAVTLSAKLRRPRRGTRPDGQPPRGTPCCSATCRAFGCPPPLEATPTCGTCTSSASTTATTSSPSSARRGSEPGCTTPTPWHLTPAYAHLGYPPGSCPVAERAAGRSCRCRCSRT